MSLPLRFSLLAIPFLFAVSPASAAPKVMASIKPVQSLVASIMQGVGEPGLIVSGSGSPHTYALKPSDAAALQDAQLIFWVGHDLEAFLEKPLATLGSKAETIALMEAPGVETLPVREGNGFDAHGDEPADGAAHHDETDGHIWLDPRNAEAMAREIARVLAKADPANAKAYDDNAVKLVSDIEALDLEAATLTAPLKGKGFITFHDAYQYFEHRFGLASVGAISIHPETPPGALGMAAIRKRIAEGKVQCVFAEPQFDNKLVDVILEGSSARSATLDPLGANLDPGPSLYGTLIRTLTRSLADCLQG